MEQSRFQNSCFLLKRSGSVGKMLIAEFNDEEENIFNEMMLFLETKGYAKPGEASFTPTLLKYSNLTIDPKCREVTIEGKSINLTNYEFEILYLLARHPGQVFSKEQIYEQVWKEPYYKAEDNVMSLIRRIRKKIESNPAKPIYILTVWGVGYKFNNEIIKE